MRLDLVVARRFGLSRRAAREAVRAGRVDRDGVPADEPGAEIPEDARISFDPSRPAKHRVRSRLSVLYEDDDVIVVDKPAGLLSVPTAEQERDTLLARVLDYLQHRYKRRPYAGVVHRLDKDTSGAIVFTRHREALHALQALFRIHDIEREYLAIVEGNPNEVGTLDADLVRDAGLGKRGVARRGEAGRRAVTRYRVVDRLSGASLVAVTLETGRTHQIRVHFSAEGHPVVGDRVYRRRPGQGGPIEAPRQMLHARRLGFLHPSTGALVRAEAPLPDDFAKVLRELGGGRRGPVRATEAAPGGPRTPRGQRIGDVPATPDLRRDGLRRASMNKNKDKNRNKKRAPPKRGS